MRTILLVVALICFVIAAIGQPAGILTRTAIGMALLTASFLLRSGGVRLG